MNTVVYAILAGIIVFLLIKNYKNDENEKKPSNKECMVYALGVSSVVYGLLSMYEDVAPPVLNEPFTSSREP